MRRMRVHKPWLFPLFSHLLRFGLHLHPKIHRRRGIVATFRHHHQPHFIGFGLFASRARPFVDYAEDEGGELAGDVEEEGGEDDGGEEDELPGEALAGVVREVVGDFVGEYVCEFGVRGGDTKDAGEDEDFAAIWGFGEVVSFFLFPFFGGG